MKKLAKRLSPGDSVIAKNGAICPVQVVKRVKDRSSIPHRLLVSVTYTAGDTGVQLTALFPLSFPVEISL